MSGRRTRADDAPLLAWGDALRAQTVRRARLGRRIAAVGIATLVVLASATLLPTPRFVWNASGSAPIGLYWVRPGADLEPGDMVVAQLPQGVRQMAARRRYLPLNVPLVKRVVAVAGDAVCALGKDIFLNGRRIAETSRHRCTGAPHADLVGLPAPARSPTIPDDGRVGLVRWSLFRGDGRG